MSNYREIPALLRARQPFEGNSMSARYERTHLGEVYNVYSYATVIATVQPHGGIDYNDRKYSRTTSRHQNLVRDNL